MVNVAKRSLSSGWAQKPRSFVLAWILISALLAAAGFGLGFRTTLPGPASDAALQRNPGERLAAAKDLARRDRVAILLSNPELPHDAPGFVEARESLYQRLKSLQTPHGGALLPELATEGHLALDELSERFISLDGHGVLIAAATSSLLQHSAEDIPPLVELLNQWRKEHPSFSIDYLSHGTIDNEILGLIGSDLDHSLIYTLPVTLLILWWAFGSLIAALIPLGVGMLSLAASLGTAAIYSHVVGPISATASQLVVLLVLAIGVDYSLFMLSRVREERRRGLAHQEAVAIARLSTGTAVFWSGLTVALSLVGLLLMQDTILTSMAVVSIIAVIITVCGTVFVLPSLLLLLGDAVQRGARTESAEPRPFPLVRFSLRYPVTALIAVTAVLILAASLVPSLDIGSTMEWRLLPHSMPSSSAFRRLSENFPQSAGTRFSLIMQAPHLRDREADGDLQPFLDALLANEHVRGPLRMEWSKDESLARYEFVVDGSANDSTNHQLLHSLREQLIPQHLTVHGIEAYPTDHLVYVVDEAEQYAQRTPLVIAAVLGFSFLFLLVAFRSVVIPTKAVLLNLLSTGASFGALVFCFQWQTVPGWNYGVIESFAPALLFSILFGLSMDYHVFILSRIREEIRHGKHTQEAVDVGLSATSRTITSAALIMASVFAIIATLQLPVMKQLGVGLAVAVLLDATVIRSLLLPASMVLLGTRNWYLPRWLRWIPDVRLH